MDILLVNPFPVRASGINEATVEPPLGLAYLAAYVRSQGFSVGLLDSNILRMSEEAVAKFIISHNPRFVGFSTNIITHRSGISLARLIRGKGYRGHILFGGPFPSAKPEFCLKDPAVSAVVIGEGEETLLEILQKGGNRETTPFRGIRGCQWRMENGGIKIENPRPLIDDIDSLPLPAWDLLPPLKLYKSRSRRRPVGAIFTSRGCPFQCVFCNKSIFGTRYRLHSVDRVMKEVETLVAQFGVRQIDFLDDALGVKLDWSKELFTRLRSFKLAINIQNGIRADYCDEELIQIMKEAGVFKISIGVESGNQAMQKQIRKNLDLEAVLKVSNWARKRGILVYGNFILGLPRDNRETMDDTIEFALRMDPDIANFACMIPLPGTEAYEEIIREGELFFNLDDLITLGFYGSQARFNLPGMNPTEVTSAYRRAYRRFYGRPLIIWRILRSARSWGELRWILETGWGVLKLPRPRF